MDDKTIVSRNKHELAKMSTRILSMFNNVDAETDLDVLVKDASNEVTYGRFHVHKLFIKKASTVFKDLLDDFKDLKEITINVNSEKDVKTVECVLRHCYGDCINIFRNMLVDIVIKYQFNEAAKDCLVQFDNMYFGRDDYFLSLDRLCCIGYGVSLWNCDVEVVVENIKSIMSDFHMEIQRGMVSLDELTHHLSQMPLEGIRYLFDVDNGKSCMDWSILVINTWYETHENEMNTLELFLKRVDFYRLTKPYRKMYLDHVVSLNNKNLTKCLSDTIQLYKTYVYDKFNFEGISPSFSMDTDHNFYIDELLEANLPHLEFYIDEGKIKLLTGDGVIENIWPESGSKYPQHMMSVRLMVECIDVKTSNVIGKAQLGYTKIRKNYRASQSCMTLSNMNYNAQSELKIKYKGTITFH